MCHDIIQQAIDILGSNYPHGLRLGPGAATPRPSLAWRGDSIILGPHNPRLACRVWLEEGGQSTPAGFANLRPLHLCHGATTIPPVAEAYLSPPAHMRRRPYVIHLSSHLQQLYGEAENGQVTCFAQPHNAVGGYCAQAALFMSLVMVCRDFDVYVPALHETSYDAANTSTDSKHRVHDDGSFIVRGLAIKEMEKHVKSAMVGGSAVIEAHESRSAHDRLAICHQMGEYLRHNLPVVVAVDYVRLYKHKRQLLQGVDLSIKTHPHAIVLVGAKYGDREGGASHLPDQFVFHDPRCSPYMEESWQHIIRSGSKFPGRHRGVFSFLVLVPNGVLYPASAAVEIVTGYNNSGWTAALRSMWKAMWRTPRKARRDARWKAMWKAMWKAVRKASQKRRKQGEALRRLFFGMEPGYALYVRSSLAKSDTVLERYLADVVLDGASRESLKHCLPKWSWIVELYASMQSFEECRSKELWLFDATDEYHRPGTVFDAVEGCYAAMKQGAFFCKLPGFENRDAFKAPPYVLIQHGGLRNGRC